VCRELSHQLHGPFDPVDRIKHFNRRAQVGVEFPKVLSSALGASCSGRVLGDTEEVQFFEMIPNTIERNIIGAEIRTNIPIFKQRENPAVCGGRESRRSTTLTTIYSPLNTPQNKV